MPQITISSAAIREWARDRGEPVGQRGKLSKDLIDRYCTWQEMPLLLRIEQLQHQVAQLRAEDERKDGLIAGLERQVRDLTQQAAAVEGHRCAAGDGGVRRGLTHNRVVPTPRGSCPRPGPPGGWRPVAG